MKISLYTALFIMIVFGSFSACNAMDNKYYETHCRQCEISYVYKEGLCMGCYDEKYNYDAICFYCEADILNTEHSYWGVCDSALKNTIQNKKSGYYNFCNNHLFFI